MFLQLFCYECMFLTLESKKAIDSLKVELMVRNM